MKKSNPLSLFPITLLPLFFLWLFSDLNLYKLAWYGKDYMTETLGQLEESKIDYHYSGRRSSTKYMDFYFKLKNDKKVFNISSSISSGSYFSEYIANISNKISNPNVKEIKVMHEKNCWIENFSTACHVYQINVDGQDLMNFQSEFWQQRIAAIFLCFFPWVLSILVLYLWFEFFKNKNAKRN